MLHTSRFVRGLAVLLGLAFASPALGVIHLMQIEQVIGGVNGDTSRQAIQLRMRAAGQNVTSLSRIRAFDAAGQNPIMIINMTTDVPVATSGSRILIASANFATSPGITPDFVMTNLIPASYLAAGSLTFEQDDGTILWRLCWGGAAYTGSTSVAMFINDDDGDVAPPFAGPLPSTTLQALQFNGPATAGSTTNAAQYSVTSRAAVFTNNGGSSGTVIAPPQPCPGDVNGDNTVNVADLLAVISAWGPCVTCPGTPCPEDVAPSTPDCVINVADLLQVISSWGPCP